MRQDRLKVQYPIKRCCRICDDQAFIFFEDRRPFYLCKNCGLIFTDCPLSSEKTKEHYQSQHVNNFDWSNFAKSLLEAVSFAIKPRTIFDFGSGSGKLADEFRTMGFEVHNYEPMLHGVFQAEKYFNSYDLVILNEVIEHLVDVISVFYGVCSLVRSGGLLYVGTLTTDAMINEPDKFQELFSSWWYKDDQTHVSFFSQLTFEYICALKKNCKLQMLSAGSSGIILQKV